MNRPMPGPAHRRLLAAVVALLLLAAGCGDDGDAAETTAPGRPGSILLSWDFVAGGGGWASDIADYTEATRPEDFLSETGVAPPGFDADEGFFHLAASNRSDDLFLFMVRRIGPDEGIAPDTPYQIGYTVEFASNAPTGCAGIGGAPGESVWLKVGASPDQPLPLRDGDQIRLSVDKGGQSQGGEAAGVAGVIANGIPCEQALEQDPAPYAMVTLRHALEEPITSDGEGTLWLFLGTDSGFEGRTSLYYDLVEVVLTSAA